MFLYVCLRWTFFFPACCSAVLMLQLGSGTKATWLGLGLHHRSASNTCFVRHKHGWRWSDFLCKISSLKTGWKCPQNIKWCDSKQRCWLVITFPPSHLQIILQEVTFCCLKSVFSSPSRCAPSHSQKAFIHVSECFRLQEFWSSM